VLRYTGSINIPSKQEDPVTPLDDIPRQTLKKVLVSDFSS
jgi:hypothetical protein